MSELPFDPSDPSSYAHWVEENIRFCDTDANGHVNNTAYAQYAECGRVAYMRGLIGERAEGERWIVARVAIDYRAEGDFPGQLRIGTRAARIGGKSFTMLSGIFCEGRCLATAESVTVFLRDGKSAPIPDHLRRRLEAELGEPAPA